MIAGIRVDPVSSDAAADQVADWGASRSAKTVCVASVHLAMESWDEPGFADALKGVDLVLPGGAPLVWLLRRRLGYAGAKVFGPWLMMDIAARAQERGLPIALVGSTAEILNRVESALRWRFPNLLVAGKIAPPFGPMSTTTEASIRQRLTESGARIVFVGLSCPQQEEMMARMKSALEAVCVGVGAAFEFHAGLSRRAPLWMQRAELEWLYKFLHDPIRLARRYLWHMPRFVFIVAMEELRRIRSPRPEECYQDHRYE